MADEATVFDLAGFTASDDEDATAVGRRAAPWFLGDEGLGRVEAAFGPERYARLRTIKHDWDPANLFRHNQNIPLLAE